MPGVHLGRIVEREGPLIERIEELFRELSRLIVAEQIRPAHTADEQHVSREQTGWLIRLSHENRNVLRRVSRCVEELETDIAERDALAVLRLVMRIRQPGARTGDHSRADLREFAGARHEIGVHVRLDGVGDGQALLTGGGDVNVDVAPRIDDSRFARPRTGDEVRCLREALVEESLKHGIESGPIPDRSNHNTAPFC